MILTFQAKFIVKRDLLGERVSPPCEPSRGGLLAVEAGKPQHLGEGGGEIEFQFEFDEDSSVLKSHIIIAATE